MLWPLRYLSVNNLKRLFESNLHYNLGITMDTKPERIAHSHKTETKRLLENLDTLVEKNQAAYEHALDDFRNAYTLSPTLNFSTRDE